MTTYWPVGPMTARSLRAPTSGLPGRRLARPTRWCGAMLYVMRYVPRTVLYVCVDPKQLVGLVGKKKAIALGGRALGHKSCRNDRSVLYQRLPRLFEARPRRWPHDCSKASPASTCSSSTIGASLP